MPEYHEINGALRRVPPAIEGDMARRGQWAANPSAVEAELALEEAKAKAQAAAEAKAKRPPPADAAELAKAIADAETRFLNQPSTVSGAIAPAPTPDAEL